MNILFVTLVAVQSRTQRGIYSDLLREFHRRGHQITVYSPVERRESWKTFIVEEADFKIVRFVTPNIQKSNLIEKSIGTLLVDFLALYAIKKHSAQEKFDLAIFTTPPITITSTMAWIKKQHQAKTYLLLKDIFPQNAVDIGLLSNETFIYRYFRKKEKRLYALSDRIGCMSPANQAYVLQHNPELSPSKVEVCPNSIEPLEGVVNKISPSRIINGHIIPDNSRVFIYGGNLGKPQGIDFLIECLASIKERSDVFFIIVGSGTEYPKLKSWFQSAKPENALLLSQLPKVEYDALVEIADVGLIFLDKRFTIPNFPSRLLSYLEWKKPVWSIVDGATDIGKISEEHGFGVSSQAGNLASFNSKLSYLSKLDSKTLNLMGQKGWNYLSENYHVSQSVDLILSEKEVLTLD